MPRRIPIPDLVIQDTPLTGGHFFYDPVEKRVRVYVDYRRVKDDGTDHDHGQTFLRLSPTVQAFFDSLWADALAAVRQAEGVDQA